MSNLIHTTLIKGFKTALRSTMEAAGFRLEHRRNGELKLGLWRKRLRARSTQDMQLQPFPRRLVVMPGFGDSPMSWIPVMGLLSPINRRQFDEIVFLDYPGFSGWLSDERPFHSMDLLIAAVGDVLDELKPHTLVGHSLGSWLTGHYAADTGRGERPRGVTGGGYRGPERAILICPTGMFESEAAGRHWEEKFRRAQQGGFQAFRPEIFAREPFWFRFLVPELERFMARKEIGEFMDSVSERHLLTDKLAGVKAETWLLYCEKDDLSPTSAITAWTGPLTSGGCTTNVVVVQGSGHSPQLEKLPVTAAVLGQIFLGRTPDARASRWYQVTQGHRSESVSA